MNKTTIGILAHVDSGKTTLSESLLYHAGIIRNLGRVDHGNSVLDNESSERERGITIFSKQATLQYKDTYITLLDTPGHSDFGAEAERTLKVLDSAILVISGSEGVQSHTLTLWKMLKHNKIPVFIFINKMDMSHFSHKEIIDELSRNFGDGFADFSEADKEAIAICEETLLDSYLETGELDDTLIRKAVSTRKLFPCFFGSALKLKGTQEFLSGIARYAIYTKSGKDFGARVYRISRDTRGKRLTHMKITGGTLAVRDSVGTEKINEIRIYTGAKYKNVNKVDCGTICAVTGLEKSEAGGGLGIEHDIRDNFLEPVMSCTAIVKPEYDPHKVLENLKILEEELPELNVLWMEELQEIRLQIMGKVQIEILSSLMYERFDMDVKFDRASILYKEKVSEAVEGIGHFEPLRHYAEVHLLIEPGEKGSGIQIDTDCSTDMLDLNWQRLILSHLEEKQHIGTLTGATLTDTHITLIAGRAHDTHTQGGDFRQAAFRAVRQGLMEAGCTLLEPICKFTITLPSQNLGRAVNDLQQMGADFEQPEIFPDNAVITGTVSVSEIQDYAAVLTSFTKGEGQLTTIPDGYDVCRNADIVTSNSNYKPEHDTQNPSDSIFCEHGSGVIIPWNEVKQHMHVESAWKAPTPAATVYSDKPPHPASTRSYSTADEDRRLAAIFERTFGVTKDRRIKASHIAGTAEHEKSSERLYRGRENPERENFIIIDGYNLIFAWEELKQLSDPDFGVARAKLLDILANYRAYVDCYMLVVFDAYKVKGGKGSVEKIHGIDVVYTKEAQTADAYIEKVTYEISRRYMVRVVTSDSMEQLIILGNGALRVSSRAFIEEIRAVEKEIHSFLNE